MSCDHSQFSPNPGSLRVRRLASRDVSARNAFPFDAKVGVGLPEAAQMNVSIRDRLPFVPGTMLVLGVNREQAPALSRGGTANIPAQTRHSCARGGTQGGCLCKDAGARSFTRRQRCAFQGTRRAGAESGRASGNNRQDHGAHEPGVGYKVRLGKPAGTLRRVKGQAETLRPCATASGEPTRYSFFSKNAIQARHQGLRILQKTLRHRAAC